MSTHQYLEIVRDALAAPSRMDRTGVGSRFVVGRSIRVDGEFPIISVKKVNWRSAICELLWMIRGSTNVNDLIGPNGNRMTIWDVNQRDYAARHPEAPDGDLGPIYGKQWTRWQGTLNQLDNLIYNISRDRFSRRHMVTAFNPAEIDSALPPCIPFFQVIADADDRLNMVVMQRSADCFLGLPFNLVQYGALQAMIASLVRMKIGSYTHFISDAHVYENHVAAVEGMIDAWRQAITDIKFEMKIVDRPRSRLSDFVLEDFSIVADGRDYHEFNFPVFRGEIN